jgi:DNA repair protein RecO (recombination protein O)
LKPHKTEAIILHTFAARERDKMVIFLTPQEGKMKGWAYGARGIKSRFGAGLEPLSKVRIGYIEKENEEVVRIESLDLIRSLFPAQQVLVTSISATYIAETVDTFAQAHDPSELIYRLLDRTTEALLAGSAPMAVVTYAEIWILRLAGILASTRNCMECDGPLERPLRFDSTQHGFICPSCATRDAPLIANDVAAALDSLFRLSVGDFAEQGIPDHVLFEIRALAGSVRRDFLGHELKSFDILAAVIGSR